MTPRRRPSAGQAVSIITCTKRPECMKALFANYSRQRYRDKELIVILNHRSLEPADYTDAATLHRNVRIYSMPEDVSLGSCLNYGVRAAKHGVIAKFDDDDYYAPDYLTESMRTLQRTGADIVGKRAHYMYLGGKKVLLLRYDKQANRRVPLVQGATLLFKRQVFRQVAFPDQNRGECVAFCANSLAQGFNIYAGSPYNFIAIRSRNSDNHTWVVSDRTLLSRNAKVVKARNIRTFVSRSAR